VVNNAVTSITVTGKGAGNSTVGGDSGVERALTVGEPETAVITVSGADGSSKTYTVTVKRLEGGIIEISSKADLEKIGNDEEYPLAANYRLAADLELADWTPIGRGGGNVFAGNFDGGDHTVTLKSFAGSVYADADTYLGVFGCLRGSEGVKTVVKDLAIKADFSKAIEKAGEYYAGALAGYSDQYTELDNIRVTGTFDFSNTLTTERKAVYVGGITGVLKGGELKDSVAGAEISGFGTAGNGRYNYVGGAVGMFDGEANIHHILVSGNVSGGTNGGAGTNVFAGGIAGGSFYSMSTLYRGKIEDCRVTGDVTASGGVFWSWAGGIAGTITGGGEDSPESTRIRRCSAEGTVTADGPEGSWPYAGGIVAFNYYGGLVSQCFFDGTVIGTAGYDYTGGIAGYNSKEYGGHGSRIEDCYSTGTVRGNINGGGIVGQNQVCAIVERCYSTAAVSVNADDDSSGYWSNTGAGGIAGFNAPSDGKGEGTIRSCAALNPSIATGGMTAVYRVVGNNGGALENNLGWSDMTLSVGGGASTQADIGANAKDGDTVETPDEAVYKTLGWDFDTVWKMGGKGYPVLQWQEQ
jgi:hypothetical protein